MSERMTWDKIKEKYPDSWVSIIEPEYDKKGEVVNAIVFAASPDLKDVISKSKEEGSRSHTFRYTGGVSVELLMGLKLRILRSLDTI